MRRMAGDLLIGFALLGAAATVPMMVAMNRAVEVFRYRRMTTILILLCSVHLLIGLALATALRA